MGKAKKKVAKKKQTRRPAKKNPGIKMRKLKGSTGWIPGNAFRVVKKRGGETQILVRRGSSKKRSR
jgi:hypothetical protein